ncbi:leucine--tRNA ligase [Candidatus Saccharibacteria bacterium]|nr:leucine--tRNA ligase [Candidatus Saccharibacteria bacterium]
MKRYNPTEIEAKWQKYWEDNGTYTVNLADNSKPKYYGLSMLPGITGAGIHTGHGRTFQFSDIKTRAKRQQGCNAYNPIGWDSFGLPVENYAIKVGKKPREAHDEALVNFKRQLKRLGYGYDWTKELSTADPQYYRWTQWIFNKLFEHGLAYQKESPQWWCETDQTVLANEQVEGGKCWRCGNQVTKKNLKQWFFKITEYADEMLAATDDLNWTEMVKTMQKNWIGRSVGAEVEFKIDGSDDILTVFTTRPDTLFGATFVVLAPEHELVKSLVNNETSEAVEAYVADAARKSEIERMNESREKTGVFTGSYAINPVNGNRIPIWVADYVLSGYGTGAIMAVPAHDERDFAFAEKFNLPIIEVIEKPETNREIGVYDGEGPLVNSGRFDGIDSSDAREQIVAWLEQEKTGHQKTSYKMRDWLISRQRYWGAPIPIIHCPTHGAVPVPDDQLPVLLPDVDDFKPKGGATSALAGVTDWVNTTCPICGEASKRETDTLDGYACSSWYFLRYLDPFNDKQPWNPDIINHWMPVDFYNGADHAVAHLLYARFWTRFFYKLGLVPNPEPFGRMMYNAYILAPDGTKMSKSKGNTIDPLEIMDSGYGADSLRVYEMFIAPYDLEAPWDTRGVPGAYRFLNRVWNLVQEYVEASSGRLSDKSNEILVTAHRLAKKVTEDIENDKFNTAISSMMEAVNNYYKLKVANPIAKDDTWTYAIESLLMVLSPFAPHITEELWRQIGHEDTIHIDHWPKWNDEFMTTDIMTIVVQVNGKLRAKLEVEKTTNPEDIKRLAIESDNVKKFVEGNQPKKIIYVPGKLVNVVV